MKRKSNDWQRKIFNHFFSTKMTIFREKGDFCTNDGARGERGRDTNTPTIDDSFEYSKHVANNSKTVRRRFQKIRKNYLENVFFIFYKKLFANQRKDVSFETKKSSNNPLKKSLTEHPLRKSFRIIDHFSTHSS